MKIKLDIDKENKEFIINLVDKDNKLLESHAITKEEMKEFDFDKIIRFIKMIIAIINKLLEAYCKK